MKGASKAKKSIRPTRQQRGGSPPPHEIDALIALTNVGRYIDAEPLARSLTLRFPVYGFGWKALGLILIQMGRGSEALLPATKASELLPQDASSYSNLGAVLECVGRLDDAVVSYRKALEVNPAFVQAYTNLGNVHSQLGHPNDAVASYRRALRIGPDSAEAHSNLGVALQDLGQLDGAAASYRRALAINPDFAATHNNLGNALRDLGKTNEAASSYQRATEIMPDFFKAYTNLGLALKDLGRMDEALIRCRIALQISPNFADGYANLATVQQQLGEFEAVATCYQRALAISPDHSEACCGLGYIRLLEGNFAEGFRRTESRFDPKLKTRQAFPPNVTFPQWQGESISGKSLLVWCEQGLGDQIQFCRYLSILRSLGSGRITLVCSAPLRSLLQRLAGADEVLTVAEAGKVPIHDYWTFPLSLPLHCHTTPDNVPAAIPYLHARTDLEYDISRQLANVPEFKVGICWQGAKGYVNDAERSPGLVPFKKLFALERVQFFTLQPDSRDDFLSIAGSAACDLGHEIDAGTPPFEETAALIMNLDLVIACDTSIGHLAGALGRPVWLVLPFVADWRWMMDREDSPWYPSTRLFRQTARGDWPEVFERVALRLASVVAGKSTAVWPTAKTQ